MSYRLIDSNAIADKYPEVNNMPCVFADLPNGLDGSFLDIYPVRHGKWIIEHLCWSNGDIYSVIRCSICEHSEPWQMARNYCPNCGAKMDSL